MKVNDYTVTIKNGRARVEVGRADIDFRPGDVVVETGRARVEVDSSGSSGSYGDAEVTYSQPDSRVEVGRANVAFENGIARVADRNLDFTSDGTATGTSIFGLLAGLKWFR